MGFRLVGWVGELVPQERGSELYCNVAEHFEVVLSGLWVGGLGGWVGDDCP